MQAVPGSVVTCLTRLLAKNNCEGGASIRFGSLSSPPLKDLGTDYLDLYCIHWPVPGLSHLPAGWVWNPNWAMEVLPVDRHPFGSATHPQLGFLKDIVISERLDCTSKPTR